MQLQEIPLATARLSTRDFPASDRMAALHEIIARHVQVELELLSDHPVDVDYTVRATHGLIHGSQNSRTAVRVSRPRRIVAAGDDSVAILLNACGGLTVSQQGREERLAAGDATMVLTAEPSSLEFVVGSYSAVIVPRAAVEPLVADVEAAAVRPIPRDSEVLGLLRGYLASLPETGIGDPDLAGLVVTHVHDLVALAIGATRDGEAVAKGRGVRAARLQALKREIAANPRLSLTELAAGQRITPRYVQKLFEEEGTTFSAFVLEQRLNLARRMLVSPRYAGWNIIAIALEAGFADISHFNRTFKRRYGATPSEIRAEHRRRGEPS